MLFNFILQIRKPFFFEFFPHQLISNDFDKEDFIKIILFLFGNPIIIIFLVRSVKESIVRMKKEVILFILIQQ